MSNPWFRLYTEAVDDEKLRLLAFEDRWHYIAILCCKGKGIIDEENKDLMKRKVAVKLGIDLRTMDEVIRRLAEVELIDGDTLQPLGWSQRQFNSDFDPTRNERKRRFIEKKKHGTDEERIRNTSGTHQERPPEAEAEAEAEADTESLKQRVVGEKEEQRAAQARTHAPEPHLTRSSKTRNAPTKTVIPANWTPAEATYALLEKQGIHRAFADECLDEFRLYWTERQERRPGWESTFVNSVKRSWERHPVTPVVQVPANQHERVIAKNGTSIDAWLNRSTPAVIEGECCEIH